MSGSTHLISTNTLCDHAVMHTASRIAAREEILTPDAPCCDTRNDGSKGKEGTLTRCQHTSVPSKETSYDDEIVPRYRLGTYTLADCAVDWSRHTE